MGGKVIGRVLIGLLVLALVAVGLDFAARWYVSDQVAAAAQRTLKLEQKPTVSIEGWPFLPMYQKREFPAIRVAAQQLSVPMSGARFLVNDVTVLLQEVKLGADATKITNLTGRATMPYSSVGAMTSGTAAFAGSGRLALTFAIDVAGAKAEVVVTSKPTLDAAAQRIVFGDPQVTVNGQPAPETLRGGLLSSLAHPIKISVGTIRVNTLAVTEAGLVAEIAVKDYKLPPLK